MKILLSARGSRGDVQPVIEVAKAFRARGHEVRLCVPETFEPDVEGRDLRPRYYSEDSKQMMAGFGSGWAGVKNALAWFSRTIDEQFEVMVEASEGVDLLVTGTNEISAPSIAELRRVPFYRITYAPMMEGYQSHPLLPWQGLPGPVNRAAWTGINAGVDLMARGPINANRARLGMASTSAVGEQVARASHTLFAMNTTLAPPCPSWGRRYDFTFTGYTHRPPRSALPEELERFISAGSQPLFLGFGSVSVKDPRALTRLVLDAVVLSGRRVVLGAGWAGLGAGTFSERVYVTGDVQHEVLFPKMAAVLHHGGAGTSHTAARAGVPQLALPQFADQHYWAHRLHLLGLGPSPVPPERLTVARLARALSELATEPRYRRHAAALGHAMRDEDGTSSIVAAVESRQGWAPPQDDSEAAPAEARKAG